MCALCHNCCSAPGARCPSRRRLRARRRGRTRLAPPLRRARGICRVRESASGRRSGTAPHTAACCLAAARCEVENNHTSPNALLGRRRGKARLSAVARAVARAAASPKRLLASRNATGLPRRAVAPSAALWRCLRVGSDVRGMRHAREGCNALGASCVGAAKRRSSAACSERAVHCHRAGAWFLLLARECA